MGIQNEYKRLEEDIKKRKRYPSSRTVRDEVVDCFSRAQKKKWNKQGLTKAERRTR